MAVDADKPRVRLVVTLPAFPIWFTVTAVFMSLTHVVVADFFGAAAAVKG